MQDGNLLATDSENSCRTHVLLPRIEHEKAGNGDGGGLSVRGGSSNILKVNNGFVIAKRSAPSSKVFDNIRIQRKTVFANLKLNKR